MSTRIDLIFAALADVDVLFQKVAGGSHQIVTTHNIDALPETIIENDTPCRLLLALGTRTDARSIVPVTLDGSVAVIGWRITDLFLLKPTGATAGLSTEVPTLLRYVIAHFNALQAIGFKLARVSTIENVTYEMDVIEYPRGSRKMFYGVDVTIFVKETAQ